METGNMDELEWDDFSIIPLSKKTEAVLILIYKDKQRAAVFYNLLERYSFQFKYYLDPEDHYGFDIYFIEGRNHMPYDTQFSKDDPEVQFLEKVTKITTGYMKGGQLEHNHFYLDPSPL